MSIAKLISRKSLKIWIIWSRIKRILMIKRTFSYLKTRKWPMKLKTSKYRVNLTKRELQLWTSFKISYNSHKTSLHRLFLSKMTISNKISMKLIQLMIYSQVYLTKDSIHKIFKSSNFNKKEWMKNKMPWTDLNIVSKPKLITSKLALTKFLVKGVTMKTKKLKTLLSLANLL